MKYVLGILLMVFSLSAMADISTAGLNGEQKALLALEAARMKQQTAQIEPVETAERVSKWVNIGKDLGSGLNATAKELGITANELAVTPVGMFAMILIAWNYMGESLVGVVFGFLWLGFIVPVWIWLYRARFVLESVTTYDKGKRDDGLRKVKTFKSSNSNDGIHFMYLITLLFVVGVGCFAIFG